MQLECSDVETEAKNEESFGNITELPQESRQVNRSIIHVVKSLSYIIITLMLYFIHVLLIVFGTSGHSNSTGGRDR